jgi:hypothetical protein
MQLREREQNALVEVEDVIWSSHDLPLRARETQRVSYLFLPALLDLPSSPKLTASL